MREVSINFYPDNLELLDKGLKTSTLRSDSQALKVGMTAGEEAMFRGFIVKYHGKKYVNEVGGYEAVWNSEGFDHTKSGKPKFKQTERFLGGEIPLHFYTFKRMPK